MSIAIHTFIICTNRNRLIQGRTSPELNCPELNCPCADDYFLPGVIIWDPSVQYCIPLHMKSLVCFEDGSNQELLFCHGRMDPFSGMYHEVFMEYMDLFYYYAKYSDVQRGTSITTCDSRFLAQFPEKVSIPFVA